MAREKAKELKEWIYQHAYKFMVEPDTDFDFRNYHAFTFQVAGEKFRCYRVNYQRGIHRGEAKRITIRQLDTMKKLLPSQFRDLKEIIQVEEARKK